jgi:hypothetical protein
VTGEEIGGVKKCYSMMINVISRLQVKAQKCTGERETIQNEQQQQQQQSVFLCSNMYMHSCRDVYIQILYMCVQLHMFWILTNHSIYLENYK